MLRFICVMIFALVLLPFQALGAEHKTVQWETIETEDWETPVRDPLEKLYNEAIDLYKQRRYVEAKEKFEQVQAISSEAYPSSKAFLKRIDQHLAHQEANLREMQERQELQRKKNAQQLSEFKASKKKQLEELRRSYRQAKLKGSKQAAAKKQRSQKEMVTRAKNRHKNMLALCKAKRYIEAREQLRSLSAFLSQYPFPADFRSEMAEKIEKAKTLIERGEAEAQQKAEEKKARLARLQAKNEAKALRRQEREQLKAEKALVSERKKAQATLEEREKKKTTQLLAKHKELQSSDSQERVKNKIVPDRGSQKQETLAPSAGSSQKADPKAFLGHEQLKQRFAKEIQALYQDGIELYNTEQWDGARNIFSEVEQLWPNYKSTRNYLLAIDQNLKSQEATAKSREEIIKEALDAYP